MFRQRCLKLIIKRNTILYILDFLRKPMFYENKTLTITWQDCIDIVIDLCAFKLLTLNAKNTGACWKFICCTILIYFNRDLHVLTYHRCETYNYNTI